MKILIDTYGADRGEEVLVMGALRALEKRDFTPVFIGNKSKIQAELKDKKDQFEIIHTDEFIDNNEDPARAIRRKKNASIVMAYNMAKEDGNSGILSAGSTGALLAGGLFLAKRIEGIRRACLATSLPTKNGVTLLMDTGANMDTKAEYLEEFGLMGKVYLENVLAIKNPKIGLLNVGVEEHKGNKLTKETYKLLEKSNMNFIGNIEARDLLTGKANVILADGFDGNIAIKTAEGILSLLSKELKDVFYKSLANKIAAGIIKNDLKDMFASYSADKVGGAPLLGVKSYVYKAHGSSNQEAIENAILGLLDYMDKKVIEKIEGEIR
ncbi:MAG: phosphate acyltransferase PlsX [Anaerococcus sp.]|nr:phosphate acyltransferase PlsX [Anaerococcus sp.]